MVLRSVLSLGLILAGASTRVANGSPDGKGKTGTGKGGSKKGHRAAFDVSVY